MFKKKIAFTLAEVLVTLSILGVVAAISIPSIIQNYQKQATVSRLKMAYSILDRLTQQSFIENGYPPLPGNAQIISNYFIKYLNIAKDCRYDGTGCFKNNNIYSLDLTSFPKNSGYGADYYYKVLLKNGMSLGIFSSSIHHGYIFVVDIDGPNRGDSRLGQDLFQFSYVSPNIPYNQCKNTGLLPGSFDARKFGCNISRENLLKKCMEGSYDTTDASVYPNGSRCAGLIIKDGWKISSDYPWSYAHKK